LSFGRDRKAASQTTGGKKREDGWSDISRTLRGEGSVFFETLWQEWGGRFGRRYGGETEPPRSSRRQKEYFLGKRGSPFSAASREKEGLLIFQEQPGLYKLSEIMNLRNEMGSQLLGASLPLGGEESRWQEERKEKRKSKTTRRGKEERCSRWKELGLKPKHNNPQETGTAKVRRPTWKKRISQREKSAGMKALVL